MEQGANRNSVRDMFFRDISKGYETWAEESFLYKQIENKCKKDAEKKLEEFLEEMKADKERAVKRYILRAPVVSDSENKAGFAKTRSDFYEELYLNDYACENGLISEADYCVWIVGYLRKYPKYYEDKFFRVTFLADNDVFGWLRPIFNAGFEVAKLNIRELQRRQELSETAKIAKGLEKMSELLHSEKVEDAKNGLNRIPPSQLYQLTRKLRLLAVNIKAKTYLQDSGYPLRVRVSEDAVQTDGSADQQNGNADQRDEDASPRKSARQRKQDFTFQLFEEYCRSDDGYDFWRKTDGASGGTVNNGFCFLLDGEEGAEDVEKLLKTLNETPCIDDSLPTYLFEDGNNVWNLCNSYRLSPKFLKRCAMSYEEIRDEFKRYCITESGNQTMPAQIIQDLNSGNFENGVPADVPDIFKRFFSGNL